VTLTAVNPQVNSSAFRDTSVQSSLPQAVLSWLTSAKQQLILLPLLSQKIAIAKTGNIDVWNRAGPRLS
jgi:hypothetical protein